MYLLTRFYLVGLVIIEDNLYNYSCLGLVKVTKDPIYTLIKTSFGIFNKFKIDFFKGFNFHSQFFTLLSFSIIVLNILVFIWKTSSSSMDRAWNFPIRSSILAMTFLVLTSRQKHLILSSLTN